MAGATQPGKDNAAGRIQAQTLQERLVSDLGLKSHQVATFGSWEYIHHAAQSVDGAHFVNAGIEHYKDPVSIPDGASVDEEWEESLSEPLKKNLREATMGKKVSELNLEQQVPPPWHSARYDRYTFGFAMRYLIRYNPKFMFISLNDSDDEAHLGGYDRYIAALKRYDNYLRLLVDTLKELGEYGQNTTILVTTDHGRGEGPFWVDHGEPESMEEAKPVWLAAMGPTTKAQGILGQYMQPRNHTIPQQARKVNTHLDIRPTVECLLGLPPVSSSDHGAVLSDVVLSR